MVSRGICYGTTSLPNLGGAFVLSGVGNGLFYASLTDLTMGTVYHVRAFATNAIGITYYGRELTFTTAVWACGTTPLTIYHKSNFGVAPVDKTVTYSSVTNILGEPTKCWLTKNLGASNQAASMNDNSDSAAGWYWQFNRKQGYLTDGLALTPAWNTQYVEENSDWLLGNDPCALELKNGWRLPTYTEWNNVGMNNGWANMTGPFYSALRLHAAGLIYPNDGSLHNRGMSGLYWSGTQTSMPQTGWSYFFEWNYAYTAYGYYKADGMPVRCLKNNSDAKAVLHVPGSYQGWDPTDTANIVTSLLADGNYEGYVWFNADSTKFKYTLGPNWDVSWGDSLGNGALKLYGPNIKAGLAGYYKLNVNLNNLTHFFEKTDWAVVGDATTGGWNNDTNMTYDPVDKVWRVTLDLGQGSIKFRANSSWVLNYGDDGANGTLDKDGANIAVPGPGNYTITLDLSKAVYTYKFKYNCNTALTINHTAGTVAPVGKTVVYNMVTNVAGEPSKCWITKNLGATSQALSVNEASEASAGWYWQFNRKQGYQNDGTNLTPFVVWNAAISENSDWTAANDPCSLELGGLWRLPTSTEWANVDAAANWANWSGPWNSALKLHAGGYLSGASGQLIQRGAVGTFWSDQQNGLSKGKSLFFNINSSKVLDQDSKSNGFTVRCVR